MGKENLTAESLMQFPCDYVIKIMGNADGNFEQKALTIVKRHCKAEDVKKISKRHSERGNYLSLTVTIFAQNKEQLDSLYIELSETPEILVAL
jgi:putative lipoic acid-binding regulatory protein